MPNKYSTSNLRDALVLVPSVHTHNQRSQMFNYKCPDDQGHDVHTMKLLHCSHSIDGFFLFKRVSKRISTVCTANIMLK